MKFTKYNNPSKKRKWSVKRKWSMKKKWSVKRMNKRKLIYYLKQKLCGLILTAIGCAVPFFLDGDATASVLLVPLGLYIIFTREHLMEF